MKEILKPCRCKAMGILKQGLYYFEEAERFLAGYKVFCSNWICNRTSDGNTNKEQAIKAWNRRQK